MNALVECEFAFHIFPRGKFNIVLISELQRNTNLARLINTTLVNGHVELQMRRKL